jgi:S-adenosylmethionine:tRNA ribosyltransferase-isomerase
MLKSNGKLREGVVLEFNSGEKLTLQNRTGKHWICSCTDERKASEVLEEVGITPVPPYILGARGAVSFDDEIDQESYQTVYADASKNKSVAAPTAGLHFDAELLNSLDKVGIERVPVTLHVGAGTFKGIETPTIEEHVMHEEPWQVGQTTLDSIAKAKCDGRKVIAVGTTSVRTLESLPPVELWPSSGGLSGVTDLMISPPYDFKLVDGMLTNFHLPKSTLLALVASMIGIDRLKLAYSEAIAEKYRFYSYGDAMFFLSQ